MTNAEIGTPLYMSPEQFMSAKHVDARVDIWSLGVTLYQLIAGRTPFTAHTILSLRTRILEEQPESLDKVRPEVPRGLAEVVMQCLAKEPTSRIADVATLARALEPFAGRPTASSVPRMVHAVSTEPMVMSMRPPVRSDEAETIDAGFDHLTPLPYMLPKALRVPRGRLLRVAVIPTAAFALFVLFALIGRNGATGDVGRHAATVRDEPQKGMTAGVPDERIELPPVIEEKPRDERIAEVTPVRARTSVPARRPGSFGRNGRSPVSHAPSRPPARAGASSQPPRNPASEPDPIDDRIE
jgi:serine/threonine-protein kinase